jgi:alpha-tubulin suppressor-like RCC1 family protein
MYRVVAVVLAVVCLALFLPAATVAARPAPVSVQHWGYFFGDNNPADAERKLLRVLMNIPDSARVIQLGTSNSTQYALLADGTVWAWGQGTEDELGDGGRVNSFKVPVGVRFPRGVSIAFLATDAMPYDTALAVDTKGNAWGWGLNDKGELCLGNHSLQPVPVKLPLTDISTLAGASNHAVYDSGGRVYSCGAYSDGVLGNGSTKASEVPVRVTGLRDVVSLHSSFENAGALTAAGQYYDWGFNKAGQLGDGGTKFADVPVRVTIPGSSPVVEAAEGGSAATNGQTLVKLANGAVYVWGSDGYAQLGDGRKAPALSPERIFAPRGVTYATLATGGATSYATDTVGNVWAWGQGNHGQIGDGLTRTAARPVRIASGDTMVSTTAGDVAITARSTLAPHGPADVLAAGTAQFWGSFSGDNTAANADRNLSPIVSAFPDPAPVMQVASSNSTEYALLSDGTVWAWGQGDKGELGDGAVVNSFTAPLRVQFPPGVRIAYLATNSMPFDTGLAVDTSGKAWGWGLNAQGELCLGNKRAHLAPVALPFTDVTALAGASGHAVYESRGTVYSCGGNGNGVMGTGSASKAGSSHPVPVQALHGLDVTALVAAYNNDGALTASGEYFDWGINTSGQLGDGTIGTSSDVPVRVKMPDTAPIRQVALGGSKPSNGQTVALLADGTVWAWGNDTWSQLGNGGTTDAGSPVRVTPPAGVTYTAVASGGSTSYALDTTGTVWAWGHGWNGQVGNGSRRTAAAPVAILSGVSMISATARTVVAG